MIGAEQLAELKEYERTIAPLSARATLRYLIGEVERTQAACAEAVRVQNAIVRLSLLHAGTVEEVRLLLDNIESMQEEISRLRGQLKEWEKYTVFLHAHGFFPDQAPASPPSTLTTTEDPPP